MNYGEWQRLLNFLGSVEFVERGNTVFVESVNTVFGDGVDQGMTGSQLRSKVPV